MNKKGEVYMGSTTWKKIERDIQQTIKDAIEKKKDELDTCEKEIKTLIRDAALNKILDMTRQRANVKESNLIDKERLISRLREIGKQGDILTNEIRMLEGIQDETTSWASEEMEDFYDSLQEALADSQ